MKTIKLNTVILVFAAILFSVNTSFAQCWANPTPFIGPTTDELQSARGTLAILVGNNTTTAGTQTMTAFGVNNIAPNYMTDILGIFVGDGVNVNGPFNAVGYSIGGALNGSGLLYPQMFMWHSGDTTSVYCGIHAGYSTPKASAAASYNTYVGNQTGINFAGTGGNNNTAMGYYALKSNKGGVGYGNQNVAMGNYALTTMASSLNIALVGSNNTAIGWSALKSFNPHHQPYPNTAVGSQSLFKCDTGWDNTTEGYLSGYSVTEGYQNVAVGHQAMYRNAKGGADVAVGYFALFHDTVGDNTATGWNALYTNTGGHNNVANGYEALVDNTLGISNTGIGNVSEFSNILGNMNSGCGSSTLYSNQNGDSNVAMGNGALYYSTVSWNTSLGCYSMRSFSTGKYNTATGYRAMQGVAGGLGSYATGDSNVANGMLALYAISNGNGNSAVGFRSGNSVTTDTDCLFLGALSNRGANAIRNAAAIGYKTITTSKSQMEVGNNRNTVTIGESGTASNLLNVTSANLEIQSDNSPRLS